MTRPDQQQNDEDQRRAAAVAADTASVRQLTRPLDTGSSVVTDLMGREALSQHGHVATSSAGLLSNTGSFVMNLNATANGDSHDRVANGLRTASSGAGMVQHGAQLVRRLGGGSTAMRQASDRAGALTRPLRDAATGVDLIQHGMTADTASALGERAVSALAQRALGVSSGAAGLGIYTATQAAQIAQREADHAAVVERFYPHTSVGANGATNTTYETGTQHAQRQGAAGAESFRRDHPTAALAAGVLTHPLHAVRDVFGGPQVTDDEMRDQGASSYRAVSSAGHTVANTVMGIPAAAINSQQHQPTARDLAALRALGVDPATVPTPYQLSRMPTYDLDHPPPAEAREAH